MSVAVHVSPCCGAACDPVTSVDRETVERQVAYSRRPRRRPMRGLFALWGHVLPEFLA